MSSIQQRWQRALPLVAILRGIHPDEVESQVATLIECGITLIEIPTNSPDWQRSVARAVALAGDRALIGAGTVVDTTQVRQLADAGGGLLVTPNTDVAVLRAGIAHRLVCAAGFATPTEAFAALHAGAHALKLFPAAHYGTAYVRALRTVLPVQARLLAVGGIADDNLAAFLHAGCDGAGIGGSLYAPGQSSAGTRELAQRLLRSYHAATLTTADATPAAATRAASA